MTNARESSFGERFEFGRNWKNFLAMLSPERIATAEKSLVDMLEVSSLRGKTFADVGSGSGLFSLAARKLGAQVLSFDYDPQSVACTAELRQRYFPGDVDWIIEEASVLDTCYLRKCGTFDVVYSWGVLHHTGHMWEAIGNACSLAKPGGKVFIAIYDHLGGSSRRWLWIKKTYCRLPRMFRILYAITIIAPIQLYSIMVYLVQGKIALYISNIVNYRSNRGMSWWHDQLDWIGGYPYEDAKPEQVFEFVKGLGFSLMKLTTRGGHIGCNEFVFTKCVLSGCETYSIGTE